MPKRVGLGSLGMRVGRAGRKAPASGAATGSSKCLRRFARDGSVPYVPWCAAGDDGLYRPRLCADRNRGRDRREEGGRRPGGADLDHGLYGAGPRRPSGRTSSRISSSVDPQRQLHQGELHGNELPDSRHRHARISVTTPNPASPFIIDDIFLNAPRRLPKRPSTISTASKFSADRRARCMDAARPAVRSTSSPPSPTFRAFGAQGEASYGNYNATEVKAMVNMPIITDELAVRVSGDWDRRDGFVTNDLQRRQASMTRDTYSVPWLGALAAERRHDDRPHRPDRPGRRQPHALQKQLCTTDPTGTLGCLPDSAGNGLVNPNSTLSIVASSVQGINSAFAGTGLAGYGNSLGLYNLLHAPASGDLSAGWRSLQPVRSPQSLHRLRPNLSRQGSLRRR